VGRLAYELLQIERGDAANWFHSLDDIYYYGGQNGIRFNTLFDKDAQIMCIVAHEQEAIEVHRPENSNELELQIGDIVHVAGNHWDGYSKGRNVRTSLTGLYPSYKVREHWRIVDFPFESNVSHHSSR
jgi:glycoprotein 6-alpha-L-fucosyltransferase